MDESIRNPAASVETLTTVVVALAWAALLPDVGISEENVDCVATWVDADDSDSEEVTK